MSEQDKSAAPKSMKQIVDDCISSYYRKGNLNYHIARGIADDIVSALSASTPSAGAVVPDGWENAIENVRRRMHNDTPSGYDNSGYREYAGVILDAVADELHTLAAAQAVEEVKLLDAGAVHINMLAGKIAKIGMRECAHTHGDEMMRRWNAFEQWESTQPAAIRSAGVERLSEVQIDSIRNEVMKQLSAENQGVIGGPDVIHMQFDKRFADAIMNAMMGSAPCCSKCGDDGKVLMGYTGLFDGRTPVYEPCDCSAASTTAAEVRREALGNNDIIDAFKDFRYGNRSADVVMFDISGDNLVKVVRSLLQSNPAQQDEGAA